MSLSELLPILRQRLEAGVCTDKADIRSYLVNPLLDALGWTTSDPLLVKQEYPTTAGKADYALLGPGGAPLAIIEVKQADPLAIGSAARFFEYAGSNGMGLFILTNGAQWQFYLAGAARDIPESCFWSGSMHIDLLACEVAFDRHLAHSAVVRDHPDFTSAVSALNERLTRQRAQVRLPALWLELLRDPDSILVDALVEASGMAYEGHRDDVVRFLQGQADRHETVPETPTAVPSVRWRAIRSQRASSTRLKGFTLHGKRHDFRSGAETYVALIGHLVGFNAAMLENLVDELSITLGQRVLDSRKSRIKIGTSTHVRFDSTDWFINVNFSTNNLCSRAERIANHFGLKVGHDLLLHVEETVSGMSSQERFLPPRGRH